MARQTRADGLQSAVPTLDTPSIISLILNRYLHNEFFRAIYEITN